jgi:hypothetical protein
LDTLKQTCGFKCMNFYLFIYLTDLVYWMTILRLMIGYN